MVFLFCGSYLLCFFNVWVEFMFIIYCILLSVAASRGSGVHETWHSSRDSPGCQGLQAEQASVSAGGPHHREIGKTAKDWARAQTQTKTSSKGAFRKPHLKWSLKIILFKQLFHYFAFYLSASDLMTGVPQQHSPACQRLQGVSPFSHGKDSEADQSRVHLPRQHWEGAEEGEWAYRERKDEETHGEKQQLYHYLLNDPI